MYNLKVMNALYVLQTCTYVCFENHDNVDNEIFRPSDNSP